MSPTPADSHTLRPWFCHRCGYYMDTASGVAHAPSPPPATGDLCLCMNCAAEYQLCADLTWAPLTEAERAALDPEERANLDGVKAAIRAARLPDLTKRDGGRT